MKKALLTKMLTPILMVSGCGILFSCNTVDDGDYVAPFTQMEKVRGQWIVNSVTQTDEVENKKMTLTEQFDFDTFGINLAVDGDNNPTTFAIDGNAPALLPTSGTWRMANPFVNSDGSAAEIILNDKVHLTVTGVPGSKQVLEFKMTRSQKGVPFVSYTYNLSPVAVASSTNLE